MTYGQVIVTRHNDLDGVRFTVDRADPVTVVADEILNELYDAQVHGNAIDFMRLDMQPVLDTHMRSISPENGCAVWHLGICFHNALLYVGDYIYRIGAYNYEDHVWEARWVD
jgi:hypothetical protein